MFSVCVFAFFSDGRWRLSDGHAKSARITAIVDHITPLTGRMELLWNFVCAVFMFHRKHVRQVKLCCVRSPCDSCEL